MGNTSRLENIAVLNRNIVVEGCTFTKTGLIFARADADTLARASACLQEMENCGDWWWGDYLVAYAQGRLESDNDAHDLAMMDEATKEKHRRAYVRNHASVVSGRQLADVQIFRWETATFYNQTCRHGELSNEHHRQAMLGCGGVCGDMALAQNWLDKAIAYGWSTNALRTEMRAAKKGELVDPPTKGHVTQSELFAATRWAGAQLRRVGDMEAEEIDAMLADMQPLLALATTLLQRRTAMGVAKESLSAAA